MLRARLVLEAARRKLVELDWIQGSYQKAMGREVHFESPTIQFWDEKAGEYRTIPIAKTEAVCAMGAVELALSNKVDLDEVGVSLFSDLAIHREVRDLLGEVIGDIVSIPTFESLDPLYQEDYREEYKQYVADSAYWGSAPAPFDEFITERLRDDYGIESDGVEDWNDRTGRTKEEVVAAFDRAIELARARELVTA